MFSLQLLIWNTDWQQLQYLFTAPSVIISLKRNDNYSFVVRITNSCNWEIVKKKNANKYINFML